MHLVRPVLLESGRVDILEFITRSEWPVVVGSTLWFARRQLKAMVDRINPTKFEGWGFKAEFAHTLDKVEELVQLEAHSPPPAETKAALTASEAPDSAEFYGHVSPDTIFFPPTFIPSVQITSAWTGLLAYMKALYDQDGDTHGPRRLKWREPGPLQDLAVELGLTPAEVGALTEMEALNQRILTSPAPFVTGKEARRYQAVINSLQKKMKLPEPN